MPVLSHFLRKLDLDNKDMLTNNAFRLVVTKYILLLQSSSCYKSALPSPRMTLEIKLINTSKQSPQQKYSIKMREKFNKICRAIPVQNS